ncbi:hypothetical protein [Nitratireductor indicus]|uniref:Uncharacterized protein n=1 Tax=Nitratireductor indicus C115 TaxID=1231190 RepID=K2NTT9_9HYPH|nr:hypothetical protein [Nitratireductor indicus]EKF41234.1 hypothetical protein NA8A_17113 [Nitratireductor indicus C115]MDS1138301.1 hypothetical protein [Nitratireductor indicus]SFQ64966.1 hypothetical protein SAMN05216176_108197 [Nitratireductor indicus]
MSLSPLQRLVLLFALFNLAGIPFLRWVLRPAFVYLNDAPPYWPSVVLGIGFILFVIAVNISFTVRASRVEGNAAPARIMAGWTVFSAICGLLLGAVSPWSIMRSLALMVRLQLGS